MSKIEVIFPKRYRRILSACKDADENINEIGVLTKYEIRQVKEMYRKYGVHADRKYRK